MPWRLCRRCCRRAWWTWPFTMSMMPTVSLHSGRRSLWHLPPRPGTSSRLGKTDPVPDEPVPDQPVPDSQCRPASAARAVPEVPRTEPAGRRHRRPCAGGGRRRSDRDGKSDLALRWRCAGRRGRQRRRDADLPGHGHRDRQASPEQRCSVDTTSSICWMSPSPQPSRCSSGWRGRRSRTAAHAAVVPVVVGGSRCTSGPFSTASSSPGRTPAVRERLEQQLAEHGPQALHRLLATRDPEAAAVILASNGRRIVRALEVIEITGRPTPHSSRPSSACTTTYACSAFRSPPGLDVRITARVQQMWGRRLRRRGAAPGRRWASTGAYRERALGYTQVLRHLAGESSAAAARAETVLATRRFARRQDSWFRKDPRSSWLPADSAQLTATAVRVAAAPHRLPHGH
jgi:tRNA A37 N6-isopentenylltransferase MiaA